MNADTFNLIEKYMLNVMDNSAHDSEHVYRVLYNAIDIAEHESGANMDVVIASCLLHDIGRPEQLADSRVDHAAAGAEKAYNFLMENNFSAEFALHVRDCILTHRFRKTACPATIEAAIVYDADKLDVAGATGIARTLMYSGQIGQPIYTLNDIGEISDGYESARSFFHEYRFKLEKLYSNFLTDYGRALAEKRRQAAEDFFRSLFDEVTQSRQNGKAMLDKYI